jgi:hypothetical protein
MSTSTPDSPAAASLASISAAAARGCAESPHAIQSCCGGTRLTMSDYIDGGLRRRRRAPLPIAGVAQQDDEGRAARFSLSLQRGIVTTGSPG